MALKTYNPSTPGLRQLALVDRSELYKGKPVKALTVGKPEKGGRNNLRPHHRALPRRRPQADLPHHRLQASQARRAGHGRAAGVRPQPHQLHRAAALSRRRAGLHHRAAAPRRRRDGDRRRPGRREAGQRDAARQHSRSARSSTTSRPRSARAARSPAPPAPTPRSSAATRATSRCASARASSGWFTASASPPSARCRTPTT